MSPSPRHRDVAAYALGVLEPADALHFQEHLPGCPPCRVQLGDLAPTIVSLTPLAHPGAAGPPPLPARPSEALLDRLLTEVAERTVRTRLRSRRLALLGLALVAAAPVTARALAHRPRPAPTARHLSSTDPVTGARAELTLTDRDWGTAVALSLTRVPGPCTCVLLAVGRDGTEQAVLTWTVPDGSAPTAGRTADPVVRGGTALRATGIARFEVRTRDGDRLATVVI
ncbi:zf-HC2 domain-containing protein [Streptomyces sp. NPDC002490]|uniref:zf-HC2 domain-containing protein n=1 Tax=Streptomyces sp. NPDC002490 TaxID=3154416 RepID=UPI0033228919